MALHELKILPRYFEPVKNGTKTFEIRKNDRDFKVGDVLCLKEWNPPGAISPNSPAHYTGRNVSAKVTFILMGGQFGISDEYCILSIVILST